MFRAIGRYFRAVFYLLTFRIDKASETLRLNPGVMSANYDRIIQEKRARINQYKDAISAMIAQEETKKEKLRTLTEEIGKLEKLRAGAAAKAKKVAEQYQGDAEATRQRSRVPEVPGGIQGLQLHPGRKAGPRRGIGSRSCPTGQERRGP